MKFLPRPKSIINALYIRPALLSILTSFAATLLLGFLLKRQTAPLALSTQLIIGLLPLHAIGLVTFLYSLFPAIVRLGINLTLQLTPPGSRQVSALKLLATRLPLLLAGVMTLNLAMALIYKAIGMDFQDQAIVSMVKKADSDLPFLLLALFAVSICAPVAEEIIFRLGCYNALNAFFSDKTSTILASLFFAAMHGQIHTIPTLAFIGAMLQKVKQKYGLKHSILLHAAYNTMELLLLGLILWLHKNAGASLE